MENKLLPGTLVFVHGMMSLEDAFLAIVVDREFWKQNASDEKLAEFADFRLGFSETPVVTLRALGQKILPKYLSPIEDPEPCSMEIIRYYFRETNFVEPVIPEPQSIESLKKFYGVICRMLCLADSDYLKSVKRDLSLFISFLLDGKPDSDYERKWFAIFEGGIPKKFWPKN